MLKRSLTLILAACCSTSLSAHLSAQIQPGTALLSAPGTFGSISGSGHLLTYDLASGAIARLGGTNTYSQNRGVALQNASTGFWGGGGSTGSVDRFVINGTNLTTARWNTTSPTGGDIRDLEVVGGRVYFACWEGGTQTVRLYSLSTAAAGPVTEELNLRTNGYIIGVPRLTEAGGNIYIAARNRANGNMTVVEFEPTMKRHRRFFERTLTIGNIETVTASATELFLIGDVGRAFAIDLATGMESRAAAMAGLGGNFRPRNGHYIAETGDVLVSNRSGGLDYYLIDGPALARSPNAGGHARQIKVSPPAALGMDYLPYAKAGSAKPVLAGCLGDSNRIPTGWAAGSAVASQAMRVGVQGKASVPAILILGSTSIKIDLGSAGAPGCFLGTDLAVVLPLALDASGLAEIPFTAPPSGFFIQWAVLDGSNALTMSFSETREVKITP